MVLCMDQFPSFIIFKMMRTILGLLAFTFLLSCSSADQKEEVVSDTTDAKYDAIGADRSYQEQQNGHQEEEEHGPDTLVLEHYHCEKIDSVTYHSTAFVKHSIDKDSSVVQHSKQKLILPLSNGQQKVLIDQQSKEDETEDYSYQYAGYIPALRHYLVEKEMYENWALYLIDETTGRETELASTPSLNKKGNLFFVEQSELCMAYECDHYGFEVWEQTGQALQKIEEVKLFHHIAYDGKWNAQDELFVRTLSPESYIQQNGKNASGFTYYKLIRK